MLMAICGTYSDGHKGSIRGNGKTLSAVFFAYMDYLDGRKIYTNFYTDFSEMVTLNQLVDMFRNDRLNGVTVVLDEAQVYLMNAGVKAQTLKEIVNLFVAQTRKRDVDIILTTQRYKNLHKQLRVQCDIILVPIKYHINDVGMILGECNLDRCEKRHVIRIYNTLTGEYLKYILYPEKIGVMYNSNEIVLDEYITAKKP